MNIKFEPVVWIGLDDRGEHRIRITAYFDWKQFEASVFILGGDEEHVMNGDSPYFPTLEAAQAAAVKHLNGKRSG